MATRRFSFWTWAPFVINAVHAGELQEPSKAAGDGIDGLTPKDSTKSHHNLVGILGLGRGKRGRKLGYEATPSFDLDAQSERGSYPEFGNITKNACSELDARDFDEGRPCGSPFSLPCFNYSRCEFHEDGVGPKVYIYDQECSLRPSNELTMVEESGGWGQVDPIFRKIAQDMGILADSLESACLIIHARRTGHKHSNLCAPNSPSWNGGANHVMIDFSDDTRDMRPRVSNSYAMEAASNIRTCYYRTGYDISVPLPPKVLFPELSLIPPDERKFFVTFKGSTYLGFHGSEERMSVLPLHDEANGVVIALHCYEKHNEHLVPRNVAPCESLKQRFDDHDYGELMNTTFGLVVAGRSTGTFRLGEVMSAGAIPVFVARDLVRPFREQFDWPSFSFAFSPEVVETEMMERLRSVPPEKLVEMQRKSLEAYEKIFAGQCDFQWITRRVLEMLMARLRFNRL